MLLVQSFGSCGQLWLYCRQHLALAYLCLSSSVRSKRYTASLSLVAIVETLILAQHRRPGNQQRHKLFMRRVCQIPPVQSQSGCFYLLLTKQQAGYLFIEQELFRSTSYTPATLSGY